jgi:hypothetical protein
MIANAVAACLPPVLSEKYVVVTWDYHMPIRLLLWITLWLYSMVATWLPCGYHMVVTWDIRMDVIWLPLGYHVVIKWLPLVTMWLSFGCHLGNMWSSYGCHLVAMWLSLVATFLVAMWTSDVFHLVARWHSLFASFCGCRG